MSKKNKVIRTKTLYKKRRFPQKAMGRILFILLIAILIGIGYIVMREWSARFGKDADKNMSSLPPSSILTPSQPESSEPPVSSTIETPQLPNIKTAFLSSGDILAANENINIMQDKLNAFKAEGYTAVAVELKAEDGMLCYKSTNEMAAKYQTVSENALELSAVYKAVADAGLTPIGYISTLKDAKAPHVSNENSFAYSTPDGPNWLDNSADKGGKPWLNPYMDNAVKYICDISKEISDAGFKTILLSNVMFPDKNTFKMNTIKTEPDRDTILNQLVLKVVAAVGENVTVIRELDGVAEALAQGQTLQQKATKLTSKTIGLRLDLAKIEANKEKICTQNAIINQDGYDSKITPQEVAGHLIKIVKSEENTVIPIVTKADFMLLEQIFKDLGIENYIVE